MQVQLAFLVGVEGPDLVLACLGDEEGVFIPGKALEGDARFIQLGGDFFPVCLQRVRTQAHHACGNASFHDQLRLVGGVLLCDFLLEEFGKVDLRLGHSCSVFA